MDSPVTYEALRDQADKAREAQAFELALKLYQEALSLNSESAEALKNVGRAFAELENDKEAEIYNKRAIQADPNYWAAFYNLGRIYRYRGEIEAAIEMYEKALALNPNHDWIYNGLGNIYSEINNHKKAQQYFNKGLEIAPDSWLLRFNQAKDFVDKKDYARSIFLLEKIQAVIPSEHLVRVKANLADGYAGLGEYDKSIQLLNQIIETIKLDERVFGYQLMAWNYYKLGETENAFQCCLKAGECSTKSPDEFDKLNGLYRAFSYSSISSELFQKGIQYLLEYALANPASDVAHYVLTLAYNKCGEYEKAETHAKRSIAINPTHPRSYYQLANAYIGQGEIEQCLKTLKKMLEVDPLDCYEAHQAMAYIYKEQGKHKQAKQMESRLESLKAYRLELKAAPEFLREGEVRFSLFR